MSNEFNIKHGFISSGDSRVNGTLTATALNIQTVGGGTPLINLGLDSSGNIVTGTTSTYTFTGGTVTGPTNFTNGLTANTFSATTYQGLPIESRVTGFTYDNSNKFTIANSTGGTFSATINTMTGLTVNGNLVATGTSLFGATSLTSTYKTFTQRNTSAINGNNVNITGITSVISNGADTNGSAVGIGLSHSSLDRNIGAAIIHERTGASSKGKMHFAVKTGTTSSSDIPIIMTISDDGNVGINTKVPNANFTVNGTLSATTYLNLPLDINVTGGTYSNTTGIATFTNNTGGTFNVTGFSTGGTPFTGGTVNGPTNFTGGLTANTFSATTLYGDGSNLTGIVASWDGLQVITVGENVVGGNLLFLSGDSKYYKVNNLTEATSSTELRLAISAITANGTGNGMIQGEYTTTGLTAGAKYWVGTNGTYTAIQPTGDGDIVRLVGTALSTTELEFYPDQTYIELSSSSGPGTQPTLRTISTSQTALVTDFTLVCLTGLTLTLPTAVGVAGKIYNIKTRTTGLVILNTTSSQTIDDSTSINIASKNVNISVQSDDANWIIL